MSFMQMVVYEKDRHWLVECSRGERHLIPCEVVPVPEQLKDCAHFADGWMFSSLKEQLQPYAPSEIERIEVSQPMYIGRYSAPGYMDATDWHWDTNRRALERELRDAYGD